MEWTDRTTERQIIHQDDDYYLHKNKMTKRERPSSKIMWMWIKSKIIIASFGILSLISIYATERFYSNSYYLDFTNLSRLHPPPSSSANQEIMEANHHKGRHRRLSNALPNGGCEITWPNKPAPNTEITYAASYPGCGARMTWNLVEALTGLVTGDDWNNNGLGSNVVTVKTHYPQSNGILVEFDQQIQRVFIVIRNPMKSIPSFFNHIYEMRNHLPVHSERAPMDEWIKWRDAYVDTEIAEYKKFIIYWMDRYTPENRLLITYEGLTDDVIGPEVTKGLNSFLGQARGVTTIHPDSVPCIWRAVVKNEPPPQQAAQIMKLQSLASNTSPEIMNNNNNQQPPTSDQGQNTITNIGAHDQDEPTTSVIKQHHSEPSESESTSLDDLIREMEQKLADGKKLLQVDPSNRQRLLRASKSIHELQALPLQLQQQQQRHRRLDPGHHNSQRKGPDVPRPYTVKQLDNMMTMLSEVAQRYQNVDARLYHIMMGYCEQIRVVRAEVASASSSS